jgi:hypothetical protein
LKSRRFQADGTDEGIEIVDDALIEAIELRSRRSVSVYKVELKPNGSLLSKPVNPSTE